MRNGLEGLVPKPTEGAMFVSNWPNCEGYPETFVYKVTEGDKTWLEICVQGLEKPIRIHKHLCISMGINLEGEAYGARS
jgi:hypothetical protein